METTDPRRSRGTLVLGVMGLLCVAAVVAIVGIARPQDRRTPVTERPGPTPTPSAQVGPGVHAQGVVPGTGAAPPAAAPAPAAPTAPQRPLPVPATREAFHAAVDQVLRDHSAIVHQCFREAQERTPTVHGRAVLTFVVGDQGRVVSTAIDESDVGDADLGYCLQRNFVPVLFPPNPEGRFGHVSHVFNFPP
jgi:hypothetical protein